METQDPANLPPPQLSPQPQPLAPQPKKSQQWLWWVIGGGVVLVVIAIVVIVQLVTPKNPTSQTNAPSSALLVGTTPYRYPCNTLTESLIVGSFNPGEILTRTISEESALGLASLPTNETDLTTSDPLKPVEGRCSISLDLKAGGNKTYQLELWQYATTELAEQRFASEKSSFEKAAGYRNLSDTSFVTTYEDGGVIKNYFAFGLAGNALLRLSHPISDGAPVPATSFGNALDAMARGAQQEMVQSPKDFSRVVMLDAVAFVDLCPTLTATELAAALNGATFNRTADALRHYTIPVIESRSAPYSTCTLNFYDAGESSESYPHELKLTAYALPSPKIANDRLRSIKANVAENAQRNTNLSGLADLTGLGDAGFKVLNTLSTSGRQNVSNEYYIVSGSYLLEIKVAHVTNTDTSTARTITDDMISKILQALQASIAKANA